MDYTDRVISEILSFSRDRELVGRFPSGFGVRPNTIKYRNDFISMLKAGVISFHASVERWKNPMALTSSKSRADLEKIRTGWDLVVDIDTPFFSYAKTCADLTVKAMEAHGVEDITCKFSGNKGFHIGISFESMPDEIDGKKIKKMFPDLARQMAFYLQEFIRDEFVKEIERDVGSPEAFAEKTGKSFEDATIDGVINPYSAVDIDTLAISSRHLIRMPYSYHEKSGLYSIPIKKTKITGFTKEEAITLPRKPLPFLPRNVSESAIEFVRAAIAFKKTERKRKKGKRKYKKIKIEQALPLEFFPPCMTNILSGIRDGRKRSEFALRLFLSKVGWNNEEIRKKLLSWNKSLPEPLPENYLISQLRYQERKNEDVLPPNCDNRMFYIECGVCEPEKMCKNAKNPVVVAFRKLRKAKRYPKRDKRKKLEKEKKNSKTSKSK